MSPRLLTASVNVLRPAGGVSGGRVSAAEVLAAGGVACAVQERRGGYRGDRAGDTAGEDGAAYFPPGVDVKAGDVLLVVAHPSPALVGERLTVLYAGDEGGRGKVTRAAWSRGRPAGAGP